MTKKRPRKARIKDPLARNKPLPRFGATKAQGRQFQRERDDKNRIHQLEQEVESLRLALDNYKGREAEYLRRIAANRPNRTQFTALASLVSMSVKDAERANIAAPLIVIADWMRSMKDLPVEGLSWRSMMEAVDSGKSAFDLHRTATEAVI